MINLKHRLAGRFRIEAAVLDDDGNEISRRVAADWFDNLILNQGLDQYGTLSTFLNACQVGTGSTAPAVGQTGLANRIAGVAARLSTDTGAQSSAPYFAWSRRVFRFATGVAEGTLAEVGVGTSATGNNLFSRALIQDSGGNPITITVLSTETLDVIYELRFYPPLDDGGGVVNIGGVDYDWVSRASNVTTSGGSLGWSVPESAAVGISASQCRVFNGTIGAITGGPSGTSANRTSVTNAGYTNGTYERSGTAFWQLSAGNLSGGITALQVLHGMGVYQVSFDPAIPKDNTKELTLTFKHSWGRK